MEIIGIQFEGLDNYKNNLIGSHTLIYWFFEEG